MTTSNLTFLDFLKPRRNEAALRLRNSILALAVLFVITNLSSAFPSILSSLTIVWNAVAPPQTPSKSRTGSGSNINHAGEVGLWWWTISLIEGGVCALLMMSIFQSAFALKYPRDPFPPMPTPVKPFNTPVNSPASSRQTRSKILSPARVTPQKQKPFNPTSSTLSTSTYLSSPVSTPSRTLNYKIPPVSPFNDSTNSNMSMSTSVPPSPSPLLSSPLMAYRGKHSQSAGKPLTGSFLGKLIAEDEDDD